MGWSAPGAPPAGPTDPSATPPGSAGGDGSDPSDGDSLFGESRLVEDATGRREGDVWQGPSVEELAEYATQQVSDFILRQVVTGKVTRLYQAELVALCAEVQASRAEKRNT